MAKKNYASVDVVKTDGWTPEEFRKNLADYQLYAAMEKEAVAAKKTAGARLVEIVGVSGVDGLEADGFRASRTVRVSKKIDDTRLLEKGVAPDVIEYATAETESKPFATVTKLKAE